MTVAVVTATRSPGTRTPLCWTQLRRFGVSATEAAGMLNCLLPDVRADMWAILNGNEPRCDARLAEAIRAQYLGVNRRGRAAWAQPQETQRRILTALELADGRGANLAAGTAASDLARATGLTAAQVLRQMGEGSRPFSRLLCRHRTHAGADPAPDGPGQGPSPAHARRDGHVRSRAVDRMAPRGGRSRRRYQHQSRSGPRRGHRGRSAQSGEAWRSHGDPNRRWPRQVRPRRCCDLAARRDCKSTSRRAA